MVAELSIEYSSCDATNGAENPQVIPTKSALAFPATAASIVLRPDCQLSSGASFEVNNACIRFVFGFVGGANPLSCCEF
jgi:hypothetical protein